MADSIIGGIGAELKNVAKDTIKGIFVAPVQVSKQAAQQATGLEPSAEEAAKAEAEKQQKLAKTRARLAEVNSWGAPKPTPPTDYSQEPVRAPHEKAQPTGGQGATEGQQLSANQKPDRSPTDNVALQQAVNKGETGRSAKG